MQFLADKWFFACEMPLPRSFAAKRYPDLLLFQQAAWRVPAPGCFAVLHAAGPPARYIYGNCTPPSKQRPLAAAKTAHRSKPKARRKIFNRLAGSVERNDVIMPKTTVRTMRSCSSRGRIGAMHCRMLLVYWRVSVISTLSLPRWATPNNLPPVSGKR